VAVLDISYFVSFFILKVLFFFFFVSYFEGT